MVDYVIPANDDAIRAVKLITGVMANAIVEANGGKIVDYVSGSRKEIKDEEIMEKAVASVKKREDRKPKYNKDKKPSDKKKIEKYNNKSSEKVETPKEAVPEVKEEKPKEAKKVKKAETVDLSENTVAKLREMAKAKGIKGYFTMKKAELIEALK